LITAKVCDFGLAKAVSNNSTTITGNIGTVQYMSPEAIAGKKPKTKTDVYSFAIVMYELFFEKSPYDLTEYSSENSETYSGLNVFTLANRVLHEGLRPEVPLDENAFSDDERTYLEIMRAAWSANPDNRPEFSEINDQLLKMVE
jgi:serine/threonine protein kinase